MVNLHEKGGSLRVREAKHFARQSQVTGREIASPVCTFGDTCFFLTFLTDLDGIW